MKLVSVCFVVSNDVFNTDYCCLAMTNKNNRSQSNYTTTLFQFLIQSQVIIPYLPFYSYTRCQKKFLGDNQTTIQAISKGQIDIMFNNY